MKRIGLVVLTVLCVSLLSACGSSVENESSEVAISDTQFSEKGFTDYIEKKADVTVENIDLRANGTDIRLSAEQNRKIGTLFTDDDVRKSMMNVAEDAYNIASASKDYFIATGLLTEDELESNPIPYRDSQLFHESIMIDEHDSDNRLLLVNLVPGSFAVMDFTNDDYTQLFSCSYEYQWDGFDWHVVNDSFGNIQKVDLPEVVYNQTDIESEEVDENSMEDVTENTPKDDENDSSEDSTIDTSEDSKSNSSDGSTIDTSEDSVANAAESVAVQPDPEWYKTYTYFTNDETGTSLEMIWYDNGYLDMAFDGLTACSTDGQYLLEGNGMVYQLDDGGTLAYNLVNHGVQVTGNDYAGTYNPN
jgi:hypothetical protein